MDRPALAAAVVVAVAGCHVRSRVTTVRPGDTVTVARTGEERALPPTIRLGDDGLLQFMRPLRCPADQLVDVERFDTVTDEPSLATFVVGVVVTAVGAVAALQGATASEPAGSGYTWLGAAGVAVGLPLAIGPWFGNGATDGPLRHEQVRKGGTEVRCGERPLAARRAQIVVDDLRVWGSIDEAGRFEISPFAFVDAFATGALPSLGITAAVIGNDGAPATIEGVVEATALAAAREAWLRDAGIDTRVEVLRKVPRLDPGKLSVSRLSIDGRAMLRIGLRLRNDGPGDAWQVRAVVSTRHPEVDGRIVYVGHVPAGGAVDAELLVPLSVAAEQELAGAELELTLTLRDAHDTSPSSPARFRGTLLAGAPR